jgi:hypothetical protein
VSADLAVAPDLISHEPPLPVPNFNSEAAGVSAQQGCETEAKQTQSTNCALCVLRLAAKNIFKIQKVFSRTRRRFLLLQALYTAMTVIIEQLICSQRNVNGQAQLAWVGVLSCLCQKIFTADSWNIWLA